MKDLNKYRGCLIGGAAGDALGYPVEFLDDAAIFSRYGENGITEYSLVNGAAEISDDTQMTLFTANALLLGTTRGMPCGTMRSYSNYMALCYKDWIITQITDESGYAEPKYSWLNNVPEMNHSREPGRTCLKYLMNDNLGTPESPKNDSKGCGGVMRVAPIGLYFEGKRFTATEIDRIGAEAAALTHGHQLGYMPASVLVHIIHLIAHNDNVSLLEAVQDAMNAARQQYAGAKRLPELLSLLEKAINLSQENMDDLEAIRQLGEGWVAEETLAIAVYCSLRYSNDFDKALIASVNHSGDSDSTGALTGNILGAYLGLRGIPKKYLDNLELKEVILELADDLFNDCRISEDSSYCDPIWAKKYIDRTYKPII